MGLARTVLKELPRVVMRVVPVAGAVQLTQTERPPLRPAWRGSPCSLVAKVGRLELPLVAAASPVRVQALAKLSLAGWALAARGVSVSASAVPTRMMMPGIRRMDGRRIGTTMAIGGSGSRRGV